MAGSLNRRRRLHGVRNVVRFNWPFYAAAALACVGLVVAGLLLDQGYSLPIGLLLVAVSLPTVISLAATAWVYDLSDLYELPWLEQLADNEMRKVVLITTGLDEIGQEVADRLPRAEVRVLDVFDPSHEHEASIVRARAQASGGLTATAVDAASLPLDDGSVDLAVAFLSAHEIRDDGRRIALFAELRRSLTRNGRIVVVEHQRDLPNLMAYTLGVMHFLPRQTWLATFREAGLRIAEERLHTPLVHAFVLGTA